MQNERPIERFVRAQEGQYKTVLKELRNGKKVTHWMWYFFPIVKGIGESEISKYYSIKSVMEAKEYLNHPILGKRLKEMCEILLSLHQDDAVQIFGEIDAMKLRSCMTLFYWISALYDATTPFLKVLIKFFGGTACGETREFICATEETQVELVLSHMEVNGRITALEAQEEYGIMRLASRIGDLKRMGFQIGAETVVGKNRNGKRCRYAAYYLE